NSKDEKVYGIKIEKRHHLRCLFSILIPYTFSSLLFFKRFVGINTKISSPPTVTIEIISCLFPLLNCNIITVCEIILI
ncbi:hypothetical protein, partial [Bacillus toyonensis]|uniref:hypothetical protein n=1 Tax=Bacillus toyonensis TaxID=155322 RepID=UPI001C3F1D16